MPLVKILKNKATILTPEPYANEAELETLLEANPALLAGMEESPLSLVSRQYRLGGAGIADLFFVDGEGLPVLVEVKLARNPQSRREVIAQVFDYAATLTERTVDEVDSDTGGGVERALRCVCKDESEFKVRWQAMAANLRAGTLRIVVAVDMESEDLSRVIGFIGAHSDLDVRLIVIEKYKDPEGGFVYSSTATIAAEASPSQVTTKRERVPPRAEFLEVLEEWTDSHGEIYPLRGRAKNYRQIKMPDWPQTLHYEFLDGNRIGAEIHLESAVAKPLAKLLSELAVEMKGKFDQAVCDFDPKWSRSRGRLRVLHSEGSSADVIVENMRLLIDETKDKLSAALQDTPKA